MNESEIRELLTAGLGDCEIEMQVEGNKLGVLITAQAFDGLNRVKRQQLVYGLLKDKISSGEIHAVSMRCVTADERSA